MHTKGFTLINRGTIKGNHSGFTLIELLVVISIIAVLSTIGVSNFFGAAKNARDAQRKNDINALADAYEVHFDAPSSQYFPLQNDWFGSGRIPTPPEGGNYLGLLALPSTTGFEVCATLENNSTFCKRSRQITYIPTASPSPGASPSGPSPSPSPTSTTVVQDSFNRANSATSLGTSDTGQAWTAAKGTFGITGNQAYISSGCPAPAYAVVDAGITDAIIQVTLPANIQDARIPFRYVDLNNMYWLETAGGSYQLNKFLNGVRSVPASSGITPANGDIIKITVSGTSINVAINGTTRITYNDTSSPINGTKYGIGTWCTTTMRFDDFSVSTVPVVPSPSPIAPLATNTSYDMKVLVLKYFPLTANGQNIDLTYTGDVGDPYTTIRQRTIDITNNLKTDLEKATKYLGYSNGLAASSLRYTIVDTKEYTQYVPFDPTNRRPLYNQILTDNSVCNYVQNMGVNEIWMWAYQGPNNPAFGGNAYLNISESKMSGPFGDISNSYRGNDMPNCNKTYRLYVFNYGRGTAEAMESWGHQMESELDAVDQQNVFRSKFQGPNYPQTLGVNGRCGSVHNPPNARYEYDRDNQTPQNSDCLDWNPDSLGTLSSISCSTWSPGCSYAGGDSNNPIINYEIWNWQNIPGMNNNKAYQGKQFRNWWDIHGDFDNVMGNNRRLTVN